MDGGEIGCYLLGVRVIVCRHLENSKTSMYVNLEISGSLMVLFNKNHST